MKLTKLLTITATILAIGSASFAGGSKRPETSGSNSSAYSKSSATSYSRSSANQSQGQSQAMYSNTTNIEAPQAPSVTGGSSCGVGASIGTAGTVGSVMVPLSAGVSWESRSCVVMREAMFLAQISGNKMALQHMQRIKRVRKTVREMGNVITVSSGAASR